MNFGRRQNKCGQPWSLTDNQSQVQKDHMHFFLEEYFHFFQRIQFVQLFDFSTADGELIEIASNSNQLKQYACLIQLEILRGIILDLAK
jgi:hypothetical protein